MITALIRTLDGRMLRRLVFLSLTLIWAGVIFSLSAQDSNESSDMSGGLIDRVCEWVVPEYDGFNGKERTEFVDDLQFFVRKAAHFTAYTILSLLAAQVMLTFKRPESLPKRLLISWSFCVLYAVSDEIHQTFVPGRSGEVRDVLIDSSGALLGSLATMGICVLILRRRKRETAVLP